MTMQITLLDDAIKSIIVKQTRRDRRAYTRDELLKLRNVPASLELPVFFDDRLVKRKTVKPRSVRFESLESNSRRYGQRNSSFSIAGHKRFGADKYIGGSQSAGFRPASFKTMQKPYEDKRQDVREYSNSHFSSLPKPQWFTEGPSNADEQIELDDLKMPSHRLSNIGDKCEENISVFPGTSKSETEDHKDVCIQNNTEAGSATAGNVIPSEPLNNKSKNIQKPSEKTKIYTLREIELELRVRSANYESDNDMTGYYKLLEMVGITFDRSVSPILTQANLLKGVHSSDPLTNEKIEKLTHNGAPVASRSRVEDDAKIKVSEDSPLIPALDEKVPSHVPQHVFPPENLGNNAFRWIRAITNAASANAFISQNMESSCNLESDLSVQTDNDVEPLYQAPHCNAFPGHGHENEDAKFIGHNTENSFSCQALPFQVNMNFPTNAGYNRLYDRFFPSLAFPNPNKLLSRPHFQPFIMQKLLQQQNLAKFGYLADSALNLLQWRNLQNIMTGYATMPEFQQFSNSHCTAYGPANGAAMCANPQDYRQQIQQEEGQQSFSG